MFNDNLLKVTEPFSADQLSAAVQAEINNMRENGYDTDRVPSAEQLAAVHAYAFDGVCPIGRDKARALFPGWHMDDWLNNALTFAGVVDVLIELSSGPGAKPVLLVQTLYAFYARAKLDAWLAENPQALPDHRRVPVYSLPGYDLDSDEITSLSVLGLPEHELSIREVALLARLSEVTVRNAASPSRGAELNLQRVSYRTSVGGKTRNLNRSVVTPEDALDYLLKQQRFCLSAVTF